MATRMEVQQRQPQLLATAQLINKCVARFFQRLGHRVTQVNQVAVVRQDLTGCEVVFFAGGFEFVDGFWTQRRGPPLALVFGKQRKGGRANLSRANGGICHAAGGAHMRTNVFHKNSC